MHTLRFGLTTCCTLALSLAACDPVVDKDDTAADSMGETGATTDGTDTDGAEPDSDGATSGASDSASGGDSDSDSDSDGATSGGTSPGTDTDDPGATTGEEPPPEQDWYTVALRYEDLPEPDPGGETTVGSSGTTDTGGDAHAPDALVVKLSTIANSCGEPSPFLPCGENHSLSLIIEPEHQAVGTYALFEDVDAFFTATGPIRNDDPEDCWWGGGSVGGTLEILAIDETHIEARLLDTDVFDFDADVEFTAEVCP